MPHARFRKSGANPTGTQHRRRYLARMAAAPGKKHKASPILSGGIRFASVQECLDFLPAEERRLMEQLRELVLSAGPELKERLSFNVLCYRARRDVCFLWPASVLWGPRRTHDGVRFGLQHADLVPDSEGYLERGGRKQVYWRDLSTLTAADERALRALVRAAIVADEEHARGLR